MAAKKLKRVKTAGQWGEAIWEMTHEVNLQSIAFQKKLHGEGCSKEQIEEARRPYERRQEKLDWAKRLAYVLRAMELDGPDPDLWYRVERIVEDILSERVEVQR